MTPLYIIYSSVLFAYSIYAVFYLQTGFADRFFSSPFRYLLYGFLLIAIIYLSVLSLLRRLKDARQSLKEKEQAYETIEKQKMELEWQAKNMTDSLNYAQRIQEALLPSEAYFKKFFSESFIFYRPKDIVSGDFYWIGEKDGKVYIVGADCTGHGVPGALMSMIGIDIIERTFNEEKKWSPSGILAVLSKELEKTFSREKNIGTIIRDGMDVGICIIDRNAKMLEFAGAFFSLYLFRNNSLTEIKGDKIIIGMNPLNLPYNNHESEIMEDDILYIFSDGYIDQFGGTGNKKFMYRRFRYLLTTIHRFPVNDQKSILEENIRTWMGSTPQVDDMMVLGFKPLG